MNPEEQQAKIAIQDLQFRLFVRGIEEVIQFECRDLYGSCFFRFVWIPRGSVYYDLPRFYGGHRLQWFWKKAKNKRWLRIGPVFEGA